MTGERGAPQVMIRTCPNSPAPHSLAPEPVLWRCHTPCCLLAAHDSSGRSAHLEPWHNAVLVEQVTPLARHPQTLVPGSEIILAHGACLHPESGLISTPKPQSSEEPSPSSRLPLVLSRLDSNACISTSPCLFRIITEGIEMVRPRAAPFPEDSPFESLMVKGHGVSTELTTTTPAAPASCARSTLSAKLHLPRRHTTTLPA